VGDPAEDGADDGEWLAGVEEAEAAPQEPDGRMGWLAGVEEAEAAPQEPDGTRGARWG
jgi:hypothetical protein